MEVLLPALIDWMKDWSSLATSRKVVDTLDELTRDDSGGTLASASLRSYKYTIH